jgi:hypothetical protein
MLLVDWKYGNFKDMKIQCSMSPSPRMGSYWHQGVVMILCGCGRLPVAQKYDNFKDI